MLSPIEDSILRQRDKEIALKMRSDNYEKFKSLVRMHLSFELELNTEEFDMPCNEYIYYEKGKMKKWNPMAKTKMKGCTSTNITKSPSNITSIQVTMDLIAHLRKLKNYILVKDNIKQEGIFRRTGAVTRQNELRSLLSKRENIDLDVYSVHDCATIFKSILGDLSEPLLTDAHYSIHCQLADLCKENGKQDNGKKFNHILNIVQILMLLLPKENYQLLEDIIEMLNTTAKYGKYNKMSSDTLATLFSPHLICPRNLPPEALHYISQNMTPVISFLIAQGTKIFDIPSKLATDIRAYYEVKRKRTMSPEYTLDESISDVSTVNTVYTFIDREKTKEANNSNPTDQALASLYAHIQGLPESSKKRKLIKQFNKENGQGTPLQVLRMKSSQRTTKSISDSIKKHIFHKSITAKAPKRSHSTSTSNVSTPNSVPSKNPKLRVLFQSPLPYEGSFSNIKNSMSTITKTEENKKFNFDKQDNKRPSNLFEKVSFQEDKSQELYQSTEYLSSPNNSDLKSKYKSEPNLTQIFNEDETSSTIDLHNSNSSDHSSLGGNSFGISLKKKLIKGVSMGNLRFSFVTPEATKTVKRAASLFIKAKSSTNTDGALNKNDSEKDKEFFSNDLKSFHLTEEGIDELNSTDDDLIQNLNVFHNIGDYNTPIQNRLSISPITKSTQRMPKSMQESIMTPRSRKPVMLAALLGTSADQNKSNEIDFNELDEDSFMKNNVEGAETSFENINYKKNAPNTLSKDFKEYLLSRSVLTASPKTESISSRSDSSCSLEIDDLQNSEITQSMLYCLDGNEPDRAASNNEEALNDCLMITEYPEETSL